MTAGAEPSKAAGFAEAQLRRRLHALPAPENEDQRWLIMSYRLKKLEKGELLIGIKIILGFLGNSVMLLPCGTWLLWHVPTGAGSCEVSAAMLASPEETSWACAQQEIPLFLSVPGV